MEQISSYFESVRKKISVAIYLKEEIINSIKEEAGVEIKKQDFKIKEGVVFCNVTGPKKTEIFLNKEKIITSVNNKLGFNVVETIR